MSVRVYVCLLLCLCLFVAVIMFVSFSVCLFVCFSFIFARIKYFVYLCASYFQNHNAMITNEQVLNKAEQTDTTLLLFMDILVSSSARISDVLKLRSSACCRDGVIIIKQGKGSNTLICRTFRSSAVISALAGTDILLFPCYSYWFIYRLLLKWGCAFKSRGNVNKSVTHSFRHSNANDLYKQTGDIAAVSALLGHKSQKSAFYYIEEKRAMRKQRVNVLECAQGDLSPVRVARGYIIYINSKQR